MSVIQNMQKIMNYIDGKLVSPVAGLFLENISPATGEPWSYVAESGAADVDAAVTAAQKAYPAWSALSARARADWLRKISVAIMSRLGSFADAESEDNGKPLKMATELDIPRAAYNFEFFADAATQFASEAHVNENHVNYTIRAPLGVVGCISPWNLPLYLLSWKIAPALAAGNCVVAKPSEITPMTAFLLAQVCVDIGLPPGVLNIVHGTGGACGSALVAHEGIAAISFTGSTATGAAIAQSLAPKFKKVSLEMGGKNPTLVFADSNLEETTTNAVRSAFSNQGQICLCGSRILVEKSIYEPFKKLMLAKIEKLRVGDPRESTSDQGAVVSRAHFDKVMSHIGIAVAEGGKVLCGGRSVEVPGRCSSGYFIAPTLIEGLGPHCRTNQEEIFGPVATIAPFESEAEALTLANSTRYGLAANVWTKDVSRAHRVAAQLHSGIVWINTWMARDLRTPFGGVGDSGVGREGGFDAMRFFTEAKNVCLKI